MVFQRGPDNKEAIGKTIGKTIGKKRETDDRPKRPRQKGYKRRKKRRNWAHL